MLKKAISGVILMAIAVGFASCSDDDNDQPIQMTDLEENVYECELNGVTVLNFYPVYLFRLIKDSIPDKFNEKKYEKFFYNPYRSRMMLQMRATTPSYAPMKVKATMETDTTITLDFTQLLQELTFRITGYYSGLLIWADSSIVDLVKGKITVQEFWNSITFVEPGKQYRKVVNLMNSGITFSSPFYTRGKVTLPIEIVEDSIHFSKKLVNIQDAGVLNMFKELLGTVFIGKLITENWEFDNSAWLTANLLFSDMTLNCIGSYDGSIKGEDFSLNMYFECGVNSLATIELRFQISNNEKFEISILDNNLDNNYYLD